MEIRIHDNGLGIGAEDQACLFLPFHTTKGTAEKGTGLGMYVVWELLKTHGGNIRLEHSAYGKGTTFLIELPIPEDERRWLK
jgi:C4-dicarboxylate-specific signal transduction histidine kinase